MQGHSFELDVVFPYAPLIDLLRSYLAPLPAAEMISLLGPLASELVKLLPELALAQPDITPSTQLDPEAEKRRLFETLIYLFTNMMSAKAKESETSPRVNRPMLLIIEDLH